VRKITPLGVGVTGGTARRAGASDCVGTPGNGPALHNGDTTMYRSIRNLLIAAVLGLGLLPSQPGHAFASLSNTEQQAQPAAAAAAPPAPAAPYAHAAPSAEQAAQAAQQQRMAAKQRAMQAAMAKRQAEESRKAARRAFVGGVIIGVLAARRR
jgi:hypothetical protein